MWPYNVLMWSVVWPHNVECGVQGSNYASLHKTRKRVSLEQTNTDLVVDGTVVPDVVDGDVASSVPTN